MWLVKSVSNLELFELKLAWDKGPTFNALNVHVGHFQ